MHPYPPDLTTLRRLRPLAQFTDEQLQSLTSQLNVETAVDKEPLIELGSTEDFSLFIVEGEVLTLARDGIVKQLVFSLKDDLNPVAQLRPSLYRVHAVGEVRYLKIDRTFLTEFANLVESGLENLRLSHPDTEVDTNPLTLHLYRDLLSDSISLPSLSTVAGRIQRVFSEDDVAVDKVVKVLMTDPAITAKLIRVANSAFYRGSAATTTLRAAIVRLGMGTTYKQVMAYAVNELFNCRSSAVTRRMKRLMEHSRKVAAISRLLAQKTGLFDPEQAMLAGLIHDLGVIVVVEYLQQHNDHLSAPDKMEQTIQTMRAQIGGMLLKKWNFSEELVTVAEECEDWFRNPDHSADLCDLVIVAQYHSLLGADEMKTMPPISIIPAMSKLNLGPEDSVELIKQSNKAISELERLFQ